MRLLPLLLLSLPLTLRAAPPAPAPATAPTTAPDAPQSLEKMRTDEQTQFNTEIKSLQNLGTLPLSALVTFKLDGGFLDVTAAHPPTDGDVVCQIQGLPGVATISIMEIGPDPQHKIPSVKLIHHNFSVPGQAVVQTSVFSTPGNVQVTRDVIGPDTEGSVQLIQNFITGDTNPSVRLLVDFHRTTTADKIADLKLEAPNLPALRQQYPKETSEFLLPAFRDLGIDSLLFTANNRIAWQIFADTFTPPPDLVTQVQSLVKQLDADAPAARQAALQKLQAIGQPAALTALRLDRAKFSFEQNTALDTFLAPYTPLSKEDAARLGKDPNFLADVLTTDDEHLRTAAFTRLEQVLHRKLDYDPAAPAEARTSSLAKLRASLNPTSTPATGKPE